MENRPKPNKLPGRLFGALDSAGFIVQNLINARTLGRKTPVPRYRIRLYTYLQR